MIEVADLHYAVGQKQILQNINFSIVKGEFVAIVGHNGAGKSSLIQHLNGLIKPLPGKVRVAGLDVAVTATSTLAKHIGFLFQNPDHQIFNNTVRKEIMFGLKSMGLSNDEIDNRVNETAKLVGLQEKLEESPFSLSRGFRQKLAYASVLAMNPEILILDEPTTGHDYRESRQVMKLVKKLHKENKTILMISHDMDMIAEYAERVILLDKGQILKDSSVNEVMSDTKLLTQSSLTSPSLINLVNCFKKENIMIQGANEAEILQSILLKLGVGKC